MISKTQPKIETIEFCVFGIKLCDKELTDSHQSKLSFCKVSAMFLEIKNDLADFNLIHRLLLLKK